MKLKLNYGQVLNSLSQNWCEGHTKHANIKKCSLAFAHQSFIFKYNFSLCPGFISSQNYPNKHPSNYFANWTMSVSVPAASKITFVVTDIAIECDCFHCSNGICAGSCDFSTCSFCYYDYIKVYKKLFLKDFFVCW